MSDCRQMSIQNGVTAIASGGSASPKTMEILAEGANIWRQSRICCQRVEPPSPRLRRATGQRVPPFYRLSFFAFHHLPALGDQKIACFLAEQRNCSRKRMTGRDGALRRPDIAARCPYLRGPRRSLVPSRIKLLFRQFRRRDYTVLIAFP